MINFTIKEYNEETNVALVQYTYEDEVRDCQINIAMLNSATREDLIMSLAEYGFRQYVYHRPPVVVQVPVGEDLSYDVSAFDTTGGAVPVNLLKIKIREVLVEEGIIQ